MEYRNGAQCAHNASDPQGIPDGLAQAIFFRDLKVGDGAGVIQSNLNCVDYEVGAAERFLPVFNTKVSLDISSSFIGVFVDSAENDLRL